MESTYEIIGYCASILIVISLMMRSFLKLRTVNLIGAGTMSIYGLLIHSYPVAILNALIVAIDIYYLVQMFRPKDYFKLLQVRPSSRYLQHFLEYYADEIEKFFPGFRFVASDHQHVFFILRNLVPAGLFITEDGADGTLFVKLDFVIPGYRDFKIGKFVYSPNSRILRDKKISIVKTHAASTKHAAYLRKMAFVPEENGNFVLTLKPKA